MAKRTRAEKQADKEARRAFRMQKRQQRLDAKQQRQQQRQNTRILAQQERSGRVQTRQGGKTGRVAERQLGRTGRTEFRQNPLNVAQRQGTLRGAFDALQAVSGDVTDFLTSSDQTRAFNENPEEYAAAFGIGSGQTPTPDLSVTEEIPFFEDEANRPLIIAGAIAAVGGAYYLSTRR